MQHAVKYHLPQADHHHQHANACNENQGFVDALGHKCGLQVLWFTCQEWLFAAACKCKDLQFGRLGVRVSRGNTAIMCWAFSL